VQVLVELTQVAQGDLQAVQMLERLTVMLGGHWLVHWLLKRLRVPEQAVQLFCVIAQV